MTEPQQRSIVDLVTNKITKEQFFARWPGKVCPLQLLQEAYAEKDSGDVDYALMLAYFFGFSDEYRPLLRQLLGEDWHMKHEDIVTALGKLKDRASVGVLYETALRSFPYLDYDESYSLAVKCIWALGGIGSPEATEKLRLLADEEIEAIRSNATRQLKRLAKH